MKIVEQSATYMKLQYLTVSTIWKTGGCLIALGLVLGVGLGKTTYLSCDRTQPKQATCSLIEISFLPKYNLFQVHPLIKGERADQQFISLFDNRNYLVFIPDKPQNLVLANLLAHPWNRVVYYTSSFIGEFFSSSNQSLKTFIRNEDGTLFQIIGTAFILLGIIYWRWKQSETCILDQQTGQLIYTRQAVLSLPNIKKFPLQQVKVLVEKDKNHDDEITYTLVLQCPNNERIILISATSPAADKLAGVISNFLDVEIIQVQVYEK
ncbi:hypothetical protein FD723_24960 [Nostoc sp. C052]|uniref:hypothetical protein n=1 Tax=Nostoc sp. C052 TaxID=2576902 RepID=UPI0015C38FA9|nr:hypothetical protein [Nostoc sp. C052]QLE43380.1 hypothetical protein FD723_24960 [Nostoc sp. C052]